VQRFGGFSQATFCTEELIDEDEAAANVENATDSTSASQPAIASILGW
jgi:hypothetical protein